MSLLLLKPTFRSFRNGLRDLRHDSRRLSRVLFIGVLSIFFMAGIYFGTYWVLMHVQGFQSFAYLPPAMLLGLFFVFLFFLMVFTALVAAVSSFYYGSDLDLLVSSPIRFSQFFWGKTVGVIGASSWMVLVYGFPLLVAFGKYYGFSRSYLAAVLLAMPPLFVIPCALGACVAAVVAAVVPMRRLGGMLIFVTAGGALLFFSLLRNLVRSAGKDNTVDINDILHVVSIFSTPNAPWNPSYWASSVLGEQLVSTGSPWKAYLLLLYSTTCALLALSYLLLRTLHFRGFSRVRGLFRDESNVTADAAHSRRHPILSILDHFGTAGPFRAILYKDSLLLSRDITMVIQVTMLLLVIAMYLYFLEVQQLFRTLFPATTDRYWYFFLAVMNTCLEAFVIASLGTRLVFPSVSLEGKSFWVVRASPITLDDLLRAKLLSWFIPVGLALGVLFSVSTYLLGFGLLATVLKFFSTVIICYGILALAVGFGAYFANFTWDHPSELIARFGSLVFMLASVGLIAISSFFVWGVAYAAREATEPGAELATAWYCVTGTLMLLLYALHRILAASVLKRGARALEVIL